MTAEPRTVRTRKRGRLPTWIGDELRGARRRHGWSLRDASERIGISRSYLVDLEQARRRPSLSVADDLAETLTLPAHVAHALRDAAARNAGRDWTQR